MEVIEILAKGYSLAAVARNKKGRTPLHIAVEESLSIPKLKALIKTHDAALQIIDDRGRLPIHSAVDAENELKPVKLLVKCYPGSLNERDGNEETPLDIARRKGMNDRIISVLSGA